MMMMMMMQIIPTDADHGTNHADILSPLPGAAATDETFEGLRSEALARICCFAGASVQGGMSARGWDTLREVKIMIMIWVSVYSCTELYLSGFIDCAKYDAVGYCGFVKVN